MPDITYLPPTTTDCADCCPTCGDFLYRHRRVRGAVVCPERRNHWRETPVGRKAFVAHVKKGQRDA